MSDFVSKGEVLLRDAAPAGLAPGSFVFEQLPSGDVMLATLVIGLREGLEAALIVGIIAAFLKKNGHDLKAMWVGVALAIALSIAVGVGLAGLEQALPQAEQEGLESLIGALAVVFVTGMILWMNTHARDMKRQLETEAADALGRASGFALAAMAFLAVLREGFETSVFLLATFSAANSASLAALGAVIGLVAAALIGWGIYAGGVRIDLGRFFRVTGAFLILVAAGLVVSSLRTAHEAGWLNAGQAVVLDLSWLVAPGTVQSALLTGVLGIPADPRLIEVLGWFAYLLPVSVLVYWPRAYRQAPRRAAKLKLAFSAALAAVAALLLMAGPARLAPLPDEAPILSGETGSDGASIGTAHLETGTDGVPTALSISRNGEPAARMALSPAKGQPERHLGIDAVHYETSERVTPEDAPARLDLNRLVALGGGRLPRGLNPAEHPGPFDARWTVERTLSVWVAKGALLDASETDLSVVSLTGSGLATPRTIRVTESAALPFAASWHVAGDYSDEVAQAVSAASAEDTEWDFFGEKLPLGLLALSLFVAFGASRALAATPSAAATPTDPTSLEHKPKGELHAD